MVVLNEKEAYKAMIAFLEEYHKRTKSDDVASLLGDLRILDDGITADNAAWSDWLDAIKIAKIRKKNENK